MGLRGEVEEKVCAPIEDVVQDIATEPSSGSLLAGHVNMGRSVKGVSVTVIAV